MVGAISGRRLQELWVNNTYDLTQPPQYEIIGKMRVGSLAAHFPETILFRPRTPLPPQNNRTLPEHLPRPLHDLYALASNDMHDIGLNPDKCGLYVLYQTGMVFPGDCLRADFWHFDLMRNLRRRRNRGEMAVSIGYSVSDILTTTYVTKLLSKNDAPLPARKTISNVNLHHQLGETAFKNGHVIKPEPSDVVRYDSLVLHRGTANLTDHPIHRVFMNLSFVPEAP